tara:strand:- start:137 stop:295 length:159 start_codon:yes stop_codon:yes gene_type:complete
MGVSVTLEVMVDALELKRVSFNRDFPLGDEFKWARAKSLNRKLAASTVSSDR